METNSNLINCLIIDDEPPAQRVLENYVAEIPFLKLAGKCKNVFEASALLQSQNIDLIFLDINMPKMTGLDFLRTLKNPPQVIITTAYREYALEGFELNVTDYLKKPFSFERFFTAVNKAAEKIKSKQGCIPLVSEKEDTGMPYIFIREDKVTYKVTVSEILYLEAIGDYVKVHTPNRVHLVYQTLKSFENMLPQRTFIRVHRSFIVHLDKIESVEGNMIRIAKQIIPIGASFRKPFFDLINGQTN